jgi:FAD:protein FMN transferase
VTPAGPAGFPEPLRFRGFHMNAEFEVRIAGEPDAEAAARAAAEAFRAAEALESELSRFLPNSDVSRINRLGPGGSVRVCPDTFECLRRGLELEALTGGAFDLSAGAGKDRPEAGRTERRGTAPADAPRPIALDGEALEVRASRRVTVDLGAIGKGFAVDRMISVLREWGVPSALVHGGRSSAAAYGGPGGGADWTVTLRRPPARPLPEPAGVAPREQAAEPDEPLDRRPLSGGAVGASGVEKGGHIIDPFTGRPVRGRIAAWAFAPDATSADGLSTAFMVMEPEAVRLFCASHPGVRAVVVIDDGAVLKCG